ncbi:MAG: 50S ribosomal protein L32 [Ignavibacteriaceae bacterium]|jgi:large subunit ribosomal protein L32|nr:50S ribosomal protein L32 [Ignavibacterium sp.]MCC6254863.1 50S ribosomal protein L32 [Ignavibacteriaceae bacterium]HMN24590.1 50S ribosomal protein L32 [Ignavibacteriaceae bacterium]HRN26076.1 50S ribosomal protein L32 [Ignavibacteriaceae bacterium]HRQ53661.1 50S ribosomal protein L32 [Ignavibacteriaceae bacterium]
MAHPKRKISKSRRDKRRTHYKAVAPSLSTCANCGDMKLAHRACPSCGYYNERSVFIPKS